jgi:putative restriction endonuclease
MRRENLNHSQLVLAFSLYCRTPFGKIHNKNPEIISSAKLIGRTPSSVSWKLANFARLDPSLARRNISGATHGSKGEKEVWDEFEQNWDKLTFESEILRAELSGTSLEPEPTDEIFPAGRTREGLIKIRVNQGFFRSAILAAYDSTCCVTGIQSGELLCASHIVPWSVDIANRTNPRNGLCLNALHDRAFDRGLITISRDFRVVVSPELKSSTNQGIRKLLLEYEHVQIKLPEHFRPDPTFLQYHFESVYQK